MFKQNRVGAPDGNQNARKHNSPDHTASEGKKLAWEESDDYYDPNRVSGGGFHLDKPRFDMRKALEGRLTPEQAKEVYDYTDDAYFGVNRRLRGDGASLGKQLWDDKADAVTKALDAAMTPTTHRLEVHRAILNGPVADKLHLMAKEGTVVGSVLSDKGFSSTSLDPHVAAYFDDSNGESAKVRMVVDVPPGTQAAYVGSIRPSSLRDKPPKNPASAEGFKSDEEGFPTQEEDGKYARKPSEQELILARGSAFRIDKTSYTVGGGDDKTPILVLHATVIQSKEGKKGKT